MELTYVKQYIIDFQTFSVLWNKMKLIMSRSFTQWVKLLAWELKGRSGLKCTNVSKKLHLNEKTSIFPLSIFNLSTSIL